MLLGAQALPSPQGNFSPGSRARMCMPEVATPEYQDETSRFCSPAGQLGLCCKDTLGQCVLCCHGLLESLGVRQVSRQSWFFWGKA